MIVYMAMKVNDHIHCNKHLIVAHVLHSILAILHQNGNFNP